tara:strand:+ start:195 stop:467 length:273 start_codon:yes stop_codon:yes gene_type:complete
MHGSEYGNEYWCGYECPLPQISDGLLGLFPLDNREESQKGIHRTDESDYVWHSEGQCFILNPEVHTVAVTEQVLQFDTGKAWMSTTIWRL